MGTYEELGIPRLINAQGTVTRLGGSLMPKPVLDAMVEAAAAFVELAELQRRVGETIARLIGVEATLVSSGAAGGILLASAACLTGTDRNAVARLPDTKGCRNEFVVQYTGQPNYLYQMAQACGAKIVEAGNAERVTTADFAEAITERTVAVLVVVPYLDELLYQHGTIAPTLRSIAEVAHARGVPVLVDAAAELPPVANFRRFLEEGGDVTIFSGGKQLRGPQGSGLLVGGRDLIEAAALHNNPNGAIGRGLKVGKEELVGLLKAIELYVERDEAAEIRTWNNWMRGLAELAAGLPGIRAEVTDDGRYGRPPGVPRCLIHVDEQGVGMESREILRRLRQGEPPIAMRRFAGGIIVDPQCLTQSEAEIIGRRIREVATGAGSR